MVRSFQRGLTSVVGRIDRWQQSSPTASFVYAVMRKYTEDEAGHRAALLAYYGLLALFPLLLVLTTIFRIVLHNDPTLSSQIIQTATGYFPAVGQDLQQSIHTLDRTGPALVIGVALTLFGARGVADVLRSGLDHVWQVPYAQRSRFPFSLGRSILIVVVGGLGLVITPVFFGYAFAFAPNWLFSFWSTLLTILVLFCVLVFIIKVGTSRRQPLRHIWVGAIIAVASMGILQSIGGYLMARELQRLDSLYGTFALVLGLTFWLYLQTQLLFLAFEIDSVRVFGLWPRSVQPPLTEADHKAYQLYGKRAQFHDDQLT